MKWRNSKERELLASGGSRSQTLPTKNNPHPDLSDSELERAARHNSNPSSTGTPHFAHLKCDPSPTTCWWINPSRSIVTILTFQCLSSFLSFSLCHVYKNKRKSRKINRFFKIHFTVSNKKKAECGHLSVDTCDTGFSPLHFHPTTRSSLGEKRKKIFGTREALGSWKKEKKTCFLFWWSSLSSAPTITCR